MPRFFTDEQLERASNIDLVDMLQRQGEPLKKQGKVHRWMRYDSTVIYGNKWYRHSREVGGGPIQFMQHFVNEKKIRETEQYHNAAFCGYDENGEMKQMHLRSTIPGSRFFQDIGGSDKQYCFRHDGVSNEVYVFESPSDMLSYITLHKENWQQHSYVCLGGVAIDALENVLKNHPQIDMVYLCVDNDVAGDKTVKRIGDELTERNIQWQRLLSENKDWNEDLVELREWGQGQNFDMML